MQRLPINIWNVSRTRGKPKTMDTPGGAGKILGIAKMSINTPKARSPKISTNAPMVVSLRNSSDRKMSENLGLEGSEVERPNLLSLLIPGTTSFGAQTARSHMVKHIAATRAVTYRQRSGNFSQPKLSSWGISLSDASLQ
jgi:hypothetical protein